MFREWVAAEGSNPAKTTKDMVDTAIAAHGGSVVHVRRDRTTGKWSYVLDSRNNRRITGTTPMKFTEAAAGDPFLRTAADPNGNAVLGIFNNCSGGKTPWGTVRAHNLTLLDTGILYVAKLNDDGSGEWIPLIYGQRGLTPANGFFSQANILINTRFAADVVGATKMDRPEDVEVNPVNRKVYMACTNNSNRGTAGRPGVDAANPRAENFNGHIVELTENNNDHTATRFRWEIFLLCGHPMDPTAWFAGYPKDQVAGVASPDNIAFDRRGNLWIATDGQISSSAFRGPNTPATPATDRIYAVAVTGAERGLTKRLVNGVPGGEIAALEFSPDDTTLFLSIQHPGEGGTIANPLSSWPDGPGMVPRPTVIAVRRTDGRPIGV